MCVVYRPLNFTGLHSCHLSSLDPRKQMGITKSIHGSKLAFSGISLLPSLRVSTSEAMIRNLSLTCEDIAESAAKAIAAQQKSLDSLAKLVLGSRTLGYPSLEQGDLCAVANSTCPTWTDSSGQVETQLRKITEQASWLKRWFLQHGLSLTYLILLGLGLGGHGSTCTPDIGNYPAYNNHSSPPLGCVLSKALNARSQPLTMKQMISWRPESLTRKE